METARHSRGTNGGWLLGKKILWWLADENLYTRFRKSLALSEFWFQGQTPEVETERWNLGKMSVILIEKVRRNLKWLAKVNSDQSRSWAQGCWEGDHQSILNFGTKLPELNGSESSFARSSLRKGTKLFLLHDLRRILWGRMKRSMKTRFLGWTSQGKVFQRFSNFEDFSSGFHFPTCKVRDWWFDVPVLLDLQTSLLWSHWTKEGSGNRSLSPPLEIFKLSYVPVNCPR